MNRRYFAHTIFCGDRVLNKQVVELTPAGVLTTVFPFEEETAFTSYFDGILLLMQPDFSDFSAEFMIEMKRLTFRSAENMPLRQTISNHPVYKQYQWRDGIVCNVFQLSPVDWVNDRALESSWLMVV